MNNLVHCCFGVFKHSTWRQTSVRPPFVFICTEHTCVSESCRLNMCRSSRLIVQQQTEQAAFTVSHGYTVFSVCERKTALRGTYVNRSTCWDNTSRSETETETCWLTSCFHTEHKWPVLTRVNDSSHVWRSKFSWLSVGQDHVSHLSENLSFVFTSQTSGVWWRWSHTAEAKRMFGSGSVCDTFKNHQ